METFIKNFHGRLYGIEKGRAGKNIQVPMHIDESYLTADEQYCGCVRGKSFIDHPDSGIGLFAAKDFTSGDSITTYWGYLSVAVPWDSEADHDLSSNMFWSMENRAISFMCQPLRIPNKFCMLSVVGTKSCVATYINTVYKDTVFKPSTDMLAHYIEKYPKYLEDPSTLINCCFTEGAGADYDKMSNTFKTFEAFKNWFDKSTITIFATKDIKAGEELLIEYQSSL
jgi:hypothetical protein